MKKEVLFEINRYRELMGLNLLNEGPFPLKNALLSILGKGSDTHINIEKLLTKPNLTDVELKLKTSIDELGLNTNKILLKIEGNTLTDDEFEKIVVKLMKEDETFYNQLFNQYVSFNPALKQIEDLPDILTANMNQRNIIPSKDDVAQLRTMLNNLVEKDTTLGPEVKKIFKEKINVSLTKFESEITPKIEDETLLELKKQVTKKLSNNRFNFKLKFKTLYQKILSESGKSWESVLDKSTVDSEKKIIELLQNLYKDKIWNFQYSIGGILQKTGTIEDLIKFLPEYKLFDKVKLDDVDSKYNSFNFFDTNTTQSSYLFLKVAEEMLPADEYKKMLDGIASETMDNEADKSFKKVFDYLENTKDPKVKSIWDDVLGKDESKYVLKTFAREEGVEAENIFSNWIKKLESENQNFKLVWMASDGSPIDRILGVDGIIEIDGVTYTVQIKKFKGTIYEVKGKSTLGEYYKVFSVTRKDFNSNVDYGCGVDSKGRCIMFGKQGKVTKEDGKLLIDKTKLKIRTLQKMVFIDDPEQGMKTYVNFDAINLQDLT